MDSTKISEYNPKAITEIHNHLQFSGSGKEPVQKKINFYDYESIGHDLNTILEAIEFIGYQSNNSNNELAICAGLAGLAKKLVPIEELSFLNELLIKDDCKIKEFQPLKKA